MNRITIAICLLVLFSASTHAQDKSAYQKHWLIHANDTLPYRLLLPKNFDPNKKYPLILFLHGAGERGRDNEAQLTHGWKLFLNDSIREKHPAIVVFPQCPRNSFWSNVQVSVDSIARKANFNFQEAGVPTKAMSMLLRLMDKLDNDFKLDKKRMYVGGLSMGGMGTFELVRRKPKMFAAAFPICGGANTATAKKIRRPDWWIFHGAKDDVVPVYLSEQMAAALQKQKAAVRLTIYPNANHNSWDPAFAEPDLMPWLFSNKK